MLKNGSQAKSEPTKKTPTPFENKLARATPLRTEDFEKLQQDLQEEILAGANDVALVGLTKDALKLLQNLTSIGLGSAITSIYNDGQAGPLDGITVESIANLKTVSNQVIVICADAEKELLLEQILPKINGEPKILLAGYAHYEYQNPTFKKIKESLAVPSIANGYENCLIHLFQCIENGIKNNLQGDVVEFGTFQGGTTKFLAKTVKALGGSAKIWTFDTFEGFPSKESPLDLYNHEDLGNTNLQEVQNYLQNENVEIVPGDIRDTVQVLEEIPIQLAFMDTDNYSAATAALATIAAQIVPGGAIVFDHYTGHNRFRYTIGERIAAKTLENDSRFINLHGTGVFIKLKE